MSEALRFVTFRKDQAVEIIEGVGAEVNTEGTILVDRSPAVCPGCGKIVSKDNMGNIVKGSLEFYCDNPTCFAVHLNKIDA